MVDINIDISCIVSYSFFTVHASKLFNYKNRWRERERMNFTVTIQQ